MGAGCAMRRAGGGENAATGVPAKTLRYILIVEPPSLDPAKASDVTTSEMLMNCFEGLARINPQNQVEPALADKWTVSADGKTYEFHLRDATFHNGRAVEAGDVKASWERALAPKTASTVAANYLGAIVGAKAIADGKQTDLTGAQVLDSHTLRVVIDHRRPYFLEMLTYPTGFVTCREAFAKTDGQITAASMIGTGPFKLESYQPGRQATLVANPTYWGGRPKIDRLECPVILDPETQYNNVVTGAADMLVDVPISRYAQDRDAGRQNGHYKVAPYAAFTYFAMNFSRQPAFARREVRQAIFLAIDREQINKVAYKGVVRMADGVLPPELPNAGPQPAHIAYDPARAKLLLAQAGYPDGKGFPTLTLSILQQITDFSATAQIIRANLRDNLGISVNIQEREAGQFYSDESKNQLECYVTSWIADYLDPQDFLSTLFASSGLDRVNYHNAAFDALCKQADEASDSRQRAALYGQANQMLMQDAGVVPINYTPRLILAAPSVQGWRYNLSNVLPQTQTVKTGS